jgi:hypothetical protein
MGWGGGSTNGWNRPPAHFHKERSVKVMKSQLWWALLIAPVLAFLLFTLTLCLSFMGVE